MTLRKRFPVQTNATENVGDADLLSTRRSIATESTASIWVPGEASSAGAARPVAHEKTFSGAVTRRADDAQIGVRRNAVAHGLQVVLRKPGPAIDQRRRKLSRRSLHDPIEQLALDRGACSATRPGLR